MSIRPFFTPLADRLIDNTHGTLAKFIPTTAVTSKNGLEERRYMAQRFHIDIVVTSHDPKSIAFSASTNIHESLMIGRRSKDKEKPTRFIQLACMPSTIKEVEELAAAISSESLAEWGNCTLWPATKVQAGDWSPVQWYSSELVEAVEIIVNLSGLIASGKNYNWKPGGQEFRGNFDYKPNETNKEKKLIHIALLLRISITA